MECMGSGSQFFPQCNLHEGPHFPSEQDKKFKEVMGMVSPLSKMGELVCDASTVPSTYQKT